jgi:putative molybdopterin biosynthesis protein
MTASKRSADDRAPRAKANAHGSVDNRGSDGAPVMMDTREVAAYLRLKERRIYDLVRDRAIPHVRGTGKLLFPRDEVDRWLRGNAATPVVSRRTRPPIVAGSHDPLIEWAVRESRSGLAILACGSRAGIEALARDEATAALAHWLDDESGQYNVPLVRSQLDSTDVVVIEWARRTQGLLLRPGNPERVRNIADVVRKRQRVAMRQPESGSHRLLLHLLKKADVSGESLETVPRVGHGESEVAAMVRNDEADVALGIETAAHEHGLAFVPLATERVDLVMHRRDAFEPPLQALLAWMRTRAFADKAASLRGYDVSQAGRVVFNA